jgi:phosphohistidine phosphatase
LKTLYLLRHAKSSWDDERLADHDRPLAPRGQQDARHMASHMRRAKVRPQLVLCSSAARALQTYEAISSAMGPSVPGLVEDELYGASDSDLRVRIHEVPETVDALLLIGHNPGLQDLALGIAGDGDDQALARLGDKFPTCALATLDIPTSWGALGPGHAIFRSLVVPAELPGNKRES